MAAGEQGQTRATTDDVWNFTKRGDDEKGQRDLWNSAVGAAMLAEGDKVVEQHSPIYQRMYVVANEYREVFAVSLIDAMADVGELPDMGLDDDRQAQAAKVGAVLAAIDIVVMINNQTLPTSTPTE